MNSRTKQAYKLKVFDTYEEMPLFYFHNCLKTGDLRYLSKKYKHIELSEEEANELRPIWDSIYNEHVVNLDSMEVRNTMTMANEINRLETIITVAACTLEVILSSCHVIDVSKGLEALNNLGIDIKELSKDSVNDVQRKLKALRTKLNMKVADYKGMQSGDLQKLDSQIANVEGILGKNYIDAKVVTMPRWNEYVKMANAKVESQKKIADKHKS